MPWAGQRTMSGWPGWTGRRPPPPARRQRDGRGVAAREGLAKVSRTVAMRARRRCTTWTLSANATSPRGPAVAEQPLELDQRGDDGALGRVGELHAEPSALAAARARRGQDLPADRTAEDGHARRGGRGTRSPATLATFRWPDLACRAGVAHTSTHSKRESRRRPRCLPHPGQVRPGSHPVLRSRAQRLPTWRCWLLKYVASRWITGAIPETATLRRVVWPVQVVRAEKPAPSATRRVAAIAAASRVNSAVPSLRLRPGWYRPGRRCVQRHEILTSRAAQPRSARVRGTPAARARSAKPASVAGTTVVDDRPA